MAKALALLKNSYFPDYPQSQRYRNIQRAFERFYDRPRWEIEPNGTNTGWNVIFNGIARLGGQNARFTWIFSIDAQEVREGQIKGFFDFGPIFWGGSPLLVNGNPASVQDINTALAAIFLN